MTVELGYESPPALRVEITPLLFRFINGRWWDFPVSVIVGANSLQ